MIKNEYKQRGHGKVNIKKNSSAQIIPKISNNGMLLNLNIKIETQKQF